MENLKKPQQNNPNKPTANQKLSLNQQVKSFLVGIFTQQQLVNPKIVVAFSGGIDSCVLLHVLASVSKTLSFQLSAHHVNHGLSPNAAAWADFSLNFCNKRHIPIIISAVDINKNSGLGLEAAARAARYHALQAVDADFICLAHHQDDQAETLLLQLARGAGVKGLAGMAAFDARRKLLRPFLAASRAQITQYAAQHALNWVEDESNANTHYDRNFMRQNVLPTLQQHYPAIHQTLSRSAQHCAESALLLDDLAAIDAAQLNFDRANKRQLKLAGLKDLSLARVHNLLRWWLAQNDLAMPSTQQCLQISQQLLTAKADAQVSIKVTDCLQIKRYQSTAYLVETLPKISPINQLWQGEETIILPDSSTLHFSKMQGIGLAINRLDVGKLRIQYRNGGERFRADLNRPSRTLKHVLQNHAMPPWVRESIPLIFMDETLVTIPNVGVDAQFAAQSHEIGLQVQWLPA